MLDPVCSLDSAAISWMRFIAPSGRCEIESVADLGGFAMLEGRCVGDGV
jgi:hypothetical protein